MKVILITGGTGAGKSTVCDEFKKCGAKIIDADRISRQVTKNGGAAFNEVVEAFGQSILSPDGELDRKKLGSIVFNDLSKLELLEKITHKHIFDCMRNELSDCEEGIAVLDVPLLRDDFPIKCDLTVAVTAPFDVRLERIMQRDGISREAALERMRNQISDDEYAKLADICFENNGDMKRIEAFVDSLCKG